MYRFNLEKYAGVASRHTCPECEHKRCFVRYIDSEGEIEFPDYVGRCNREDKCGYHFTPKQYFEQNPQQWEQQNYTPPPPTKPKPTSYISPTLVGKTLMRHRGHHLYSFIASQIGVNATDKLMDQYRVTSSTYWDGATLFWQMDRDSRVRTGKIMLYNPSTGRRVKEPFNHIMWAHKLIKEAEKFNLKQCLFGEHLLSKDGYKTIAIVESEKSALIASHYLPSFTWIATGGKNGCFRKEALEVLTGRKVILFPDLGATEAWREKLSLFSELRIEADLFDGLEENATDEQRNSGYDIVDFLLDGNSPQVILDKMIARNPALKTLIERFDLELIGVENIEPLAPKKRGRKL